MNVLYFVFFKIPEEVTIDTTLRVSIWLEGSDSYLMPCQFTEVWEEDNFYTIKVEALDPSNFMEKKFIDKKFFFGHPGKIIGYGLLKEIERR